MKQVMAALVVLAFSSLASAQCQTYSNYSYSYPSYAPTYNKTVVHQDIVYTRYIAAIPLLDLPTYSAYHTPAPAVAAAVPAAAAPVATAATTPCATDSAKILKLMEAMDLRMNRLEASYKTNTTLAAPPVPKAESVKGVDIRRVNQQKCAVCHQQGNESKGGDFVLSDATGAIVKLTDGQLADLQTHVVKGTMPKLNAASRAAGVTPLTVEEAEAWIEVARAQRNASRLSAKR